MQAKESGDNYTRTRLIVLETNPISLNRNLHWIIRTSANWNNFWEFRLTEFYTAINILSSGRLFQLVVLQMPLGAKMIRP